MPQPAIDVSTAAIRQKALLVWHLQRVKRLVRARVGGQCLVHLTEIICADPVCPGLATQISVTGFDLVRRTVVIHRPVAAITQADLAPLSGW